MKNTLSHLTKKILASFPIPLFGQPDVLAYKLNALKVDLKKWNEQIFKNVE